MNNLDIERKAIDATGVLLQEKGYICAVDIFIKLGYLDVKDYENWRLRKIPYLEKVIKVNLKKIQLVLTAIKRNSQKGNLKPSVTVYKSWGKGASTLLRFSKSGNEKVEALYFTHYVKRKVVKSA